VVLNFKKPIKAFTAKEAPAIEINFQVSFNIFKFKNSLARITFLSSFLEINSICKIKKRIIKAAPIL